MIQRFENLELIKIHLMIENRKSLKISTYHQSTYFDKSILSILIIN